MNKLTALVEAAKAADYDGMQTEAIFEANAYFEYLANPATILELCALLEKAEEALDGCLARLYGELYPNHPETLEVEDAITAIKQWKEQT